MKFSVIIPVFNEIKNIEKVLWNIYNQTLLPNEIIVVDWGSTDGTYEFLKEEEKQKKIKLFQNKVRHWNIAKSRNIAIKNSSYDLILCTDAGCEINKSWCESYLDFYKSSKEKIVIGKAEYIVHTKFQKNCMRRLMSDKPIFAWRNMSFYKSVREDVWGYPEFLTLRWEDTYLKCIIEEKWYKIWYCEKAIVKRWVRKNFLEIYKMYRNYTQWDTEVLIVKNRIQSPSIKHSIIFLCFFICLFLSIFILKRWIIPVIILWLILIWLYKRTQWWFRFDLHFSCAKIIWMTIWFIKWIISWLYIRKTMKKK